MHKGCSNIDVFKRNEIMAYQPLAVKIAGLGKYLPERIVTSEELEKQLNIPSGWVERTTGVCSRRYASGETVSQMATAAARTALQMAGMRPADLDAIIGASASARQAIPCTAAFVQRELGAPDGSSACFDLNATCLGFIFALQTAASLIATGVYKSILIFSSELATFSRNPKQWESAVLFGDGAAAAVVTAAQPGDASTIWHSRFVTYSSGADLTQLVGGGSLHHPNDPTTTREMNMFDMDGPAVFKKAARLVPPFLEEFSRVTNLKNSDYDQVIPHQASGHGLKLLPRFGFRPGSIFNHIHERGNCIAASIPIALTEAVEKGRVKRGDKVLLIGTGAGLSVGAMALTY
jgi:3-oxoacyl-[acyl-carrier-protein] synthase III